HHKIRAVTAPRLPCFYHALPDTGYSALKHLTLIGEYYPVLKAVDGNIQASYSFGIKAETFGHQFIIKVSNSQEIGSRDMMHGAANQDLYVGFEIMRLLDLS